MVGDSENRLRESMRIVFSSQKRTFQALRWIELQGRAGTSISPNRAASLPVSYSSLSDPFDLHTPPATLSPRLALVRSEPGPQLMKSLLPSTARIKSSPRPPRPSSLPSSRRNVSPPPQASMRSAPP
jgi:hypothetical protein